MEAAEIISISAACAFALACGFSLWKWFESWSRAKRHKASVVILGDKDGKHRSSVLGRVIELMERTSRDISLPGAKPIANRKASGVGKGFASNVRLAGLQGSVTAAGFAETRLRLAIAGAAVGFACGLMFGVQLSIVLAALGAAGGFALPGYALRERARERAQEAERHLPEMLDVVALGMRSGLSFDSSLHVYASHFDTLLARELECARVQWSSGLARRDEALRSLAVTYDSALLGRVVETVVKSIRYGSSMISSLEDDAAEARNAYRSMREERIAKAPVKMMIPTGTLILPAMLIMVLGPVLLELMQGGL